MKKLILKTVILIFVFSSAYFPVAISNNTLDRKEFRNPGDDQMMSVVITNEQTKLSQAIMAGMEKYWTCSKYEFINMEEFKKRSLLAGNFLVVFGESSDPNSLDYNALAILRMSPSIYLQKENAFIPPIRVDTDKKTGLTNISFDACAFGVGIENNHVTSGPEFYLVLMNEIFNEKFIKKNKKRCMDGSRKTQQGIFYFDNVSDDIVKGKTLLIDQFTADELLKFFENETVIKNVISKTTGIASDHIFILSTEELSKSFASGKEDLLYMYTYYSFVERRIASLKNKKESWNEYLWMAPNIMDYKGKFIASLDKYRKLKKLYKSETPTK